MATNYENQKGFYENVKLDENGYMLVTGISGGGSGTSGSSGTSGTSGSTGTSGTSGSDGTSGTSGSAGTSGTSPAGGAAGLIAGVGLNSIQSNTTLTPGATAVGACSIVLGTNANSVNTLGGEVILIGRDTGSYWSPNDNAGGIAIGTNAKFRAGAQVVIGLNARNGGQNTTSVVVGANANGGSPFGRQVVIGEGASDKDYWGSNVILGYYACYNHCAGAPAEGSPLTVVGNFACGGPDATAFGHSSNACSKAVSLGQCSWASCECSISIGMYSIASHTNSVAIGYGMTTSVANHSHVNSLYISSAPTYADNATALTAGLLAGQVYKTSAGQLMIVY